MAVEFTGHARLRMVERRAPEPDVMIVLAEPDEIRYGDDGELIARKTLDRRTVEVVYHEFHNVRRVITVMVT